MADIPGEYACVIKLSKEKDLLRLAHETPCTILEAREIINFCQKKFRTGKIHLVFREGETGESFYRTKTIHLPIEPLPPWVRFRPFRFLRLGLILHEFSHILHDCRGGRGKTHGREFVGLFDSVMVEYSRYKAL